MEPPAPVTSITRSPSHSRKPALSSTTGSRPSRSSSSTWRIVVNCERPLIRSSYGGTVSASSPAAAQSAAAHAVRGRRQSDDHRAHTEASYPIGKLGDWSQHADVAQQAPLLGAVIV